jgi:hypothetical protein
MKESDFVSNGKSKLSTNLGAEAFNSASRSADSNLDFEGGIGSLG